MGISTKDRLSEKPGIAVSSVPRSVTFVGEITPTLKDTESKRNMLKKPHQGNSLESVLTFCLSDSHFLFLALSAKQLL